MTDYQQPVYPPPPAYSYPPPVNRHEGLAVAALVLGIIGAAFGVIPLTFWIALPLGMLALIFGLIGRRPTKGKWGVALGVAAIVLGIIGAIIVNNAVNDLDKALDTGPYGASLSIPELSVPADMGGGLDMQQMYLDTISTGLPGYDPDLALMYGNEACADGAVVDPVAAATQLSDDELIPAFDAGYITGAAIVSLC